MTTVDPVRAEARAMQLSDASLAYDLLVLRSNVAEALLTKTETVLIDVSGLTRPSSNAVAALLWAKRNCARGGVEFAVRGIGHRNREVLRRCGLVPQSASESS